MLKLVIFACDESWPVTSHGSLRRAVAVPSKFLGWIPHSGVHIIKTRRMELWNKYRAVASTDMTALCSKVLGIRSEAKAADISTVSGRLASSHVWFQAWRFAGGISHWYNTRIGLKGRRNVPVLNYSEHLFYPESVPKKSISILLI